MRGRRQAKKDEAAGAAGEQQPSPSARKRQRGSRPVNGSPHPGLSRPIVSGLPRLNFLTEGQVEQIHQAALHILSRTGINFASPEAVEIFRQAGARVDGQRVYLEADLIGHCLATPPAAYRLHSRNPANSLDIGGATTVLMPTGGAPYARGLDGVRRPGTLADVENFARLSAMSPEVHALARKPVEAQDVPLAVRHLACWRAIMLLSDKPVNAGFVNGRPEAEDALAMLAAVFGGESAIDGRPVAQCSINVNSPLLYDRAMTEGLLAFARLGQPVVVTPFVMAGAMGPATLAGALAQHNAEVLAGVALTQLVRPGTPVMYGTATSNVDLRSGSPAIGSPESALSVGVAAQLARHYGLPCRGGGALTDSHLPDAQSNYERMLVLLVTVLSGVNFVLHGLGTLESYLTICYEQFVIDLELVAMLRHLVQPLEINADTLALDTIDQIGPGGFFLDAAHTLRHYRQAHFLPRLSLRQSHDQWLADGAPDAAARANRLCREILESYVQPPIDSQAAARLDDFAERRMAQLLA
jgi:trimethylamine---corrinoid protein Co-methyltransferase